MISADLLRYSAFGDLCVAPCRALGMDYCAHNDTHIYAADPADENLHEENCYRFAYTTGADGAPLIDSTTRQLTTDTTEVHGEDRRRRRGIDPPDISAAILLEAGAATRAVQ